MSPKKKSDKSSKRKEKNGHNHGTNPVEHHHPAGKGSHAGSNATRRHEAQPDRDRVRSDRRTSDAQLHPAPVANNILSDPLVEEISMATYVPPYMSGEQAYPDDPAKAQAIEDQRNERIALEEKASSPPAEQPPPGLSPNEILAWAAAHITPVSPPPEQPPAPIEPEEPPIEQP
jgi:hypothetical protein